MVEQGTKERPSHPTLVVVKKGSNEANLSGI